MYHYRRKEASCLAIFISSTSLAVQHLAENTAAQKGPCFLES